MWLQFDANHAVVGDTSIVCDTKYYTAVSYFNLGAVQASTWWQTHYLFGCYISSILADFVQQDNASCYLC